VVATRLALARSKAGLQLGATWVASALVTMKVVFDRGKEVR
jgi:predicted MFS family arabinose efflux permease